MRDAQPVTRPLNETAQDFFTYGSWIIAIAVLAFTLVLWRRHKTPFYFLIVAASMVAAFGEPLYDEMMKLYFYTVNHDGQSVIQSHFTAFDVPQPVWTHSGYAILYGLPAVYIVRMIHAGTMTKKKLYIVACFSLLESCAFEIIGTSSGAYTYWGPHVFRIAEYPLVIGMLEMAQVMLFAVLAAELYKRIREPWQMLGVFLLFPITFVGANYGGGMAMIVGIHAENTNEFIRYTTTLLSMGCAVLIVRMVASFLPDAATKTAESPSVATVAGRQREAVAAD
ncbi:hypothetical protein [Patulibacter minatonensis]|uniref:hypothetical protein n=1 Tax=Patulibacter minatonensis TaxID=298163 RepID=UPI00047D1617|nr:hypothetical protein [Patulibacter minatonensis]